MVPRVSVAEEQRVAVAAPPAQSPRAPRGDRTRHNRRTDLAVALVCLAGAVYLTWGLWISPNNRAVMHNEGDQALFEWLLTYQAHALTHLNNPLWTTLLNVPMGVNLAVNTSMVFVGTAVAPVTMLLGPSVAFVLVLTLNLALSPYAWYYVLSRHVTRTRCAAILGGLFCGFAPGVVSHANGHLNFTAQYLVPIIVWRVAKLREPGKAVRNGLILGVLVAVDYSVGAEMLLFVAGACATYLVFWALWNRQRARAEAPAFLRGLAVAGGTALVLLGYPLWLQFAGPQRYHGIGFDQIVHSEDLASYPAFPYLSLARLAGLWRQNLAPNYTEETAFFGPVLVVLSVLIVVRLWRRVEVRALALTGLVFGILSLGPRLRFNGVAHYHLRLPFVLLWHLPVFDTALPERLVLVIIPIVGVLLALSLDRAFEQPVRWRRAWLAGFVAALLPLVPLPIPTTHRQPVPRFFSDGTWRQYLHDGQTLVAIPPASDYLPDGQRWQTATNFAFAIPSGFFLGPGGPHNRSRIGPDPRPTAALLTKIAMRGTPVVVTLAERQQARKDLAYWHAAAIVLSDGGDGSRWAPHRLLLLQAATDLFGQPQRVADVWVWRVAGIPPA
ncbi:MAG: hypothetical protein V7603_4122 [Micromonosporaceae bacterium]